MEAKHTPGPWRLQDDAGHPANIRIGSTRRPHVAKVYAESEARDLVCEANARLIASAPALLEALKEGAALQAAHYGDGIRLHLAMSEWAARARTAISQAEGGE